jgi:predicted metal-dependent enzyme (double-stranded beta helix superfamily)
MNLRRLRSFVEEATKAVSEETVETLLLDRLRAPLVDLIAVDDWLPEAFATPHPEHYQQYLLHCDTQQRFSVVSFVWGPGQETPIHNHTVWGLIGVLRGGEMSTRFALNRSGTGIEEGQADDLRPGDVDMVSPRIGDIHRVRNAYTDQSSISIHVYGANIGAVQRHVFDARTGAPKGFVSGFSSQVLPNIWS